MAAGDSNLGPPAGAGAERMGGAVRGSLAGENPVKDSEGLGKTQVPAEVLLNSILWRGDPV